MFTHTFMAILALLAQLGINIDATAPEAQTLNSAIAVLESNGFSLEQVPVDATPLTCETYSDLSSREAGELLLRDPSAGSDPTRVTCLINKIVRPDASVEITPVDRYKITVPNG